MKITLTLKKANGEVKEKRSVDFDSLRVGTIKRLFKVVDVDNLMKQCKTSKDVVNYLMGRSIAMIPLIESTIKAMFDLTDEQFEEEVGIDELVMVIHILIAESIRKLESTEEGLKNLLRAE